MPNPLPVKYQPNSRRLWLGFIDGQMLPRKSRPPDKYKATGTKPRYGWDLPNTRRWRKIVRKALAQPRIGYDLIVDPGAAGVGCVFDAPPSYMYTQYGVVLDAGPTNPTGRFRESQPNWQDLPPRRERLIGTVAQAERDREYAIRVMRGIWEDSLAKIWEDTARILHGDAADKTEHPGD